MNARAELGPRLRWPFHWLRMNARAELGPRLCYAPSARFTGGRRFHRLGYLGEPIAARRAEKAAARAGVAGGAGLIDQQQQRIAVAIDAQLHQALHMA